MANNLRFDKSHEGRTNMLFLKRKGKKHPSSLAKKRNNGNNIIRGCQELFSKVGCLNRGRGLNFD